MFETIIRIYCMLGIANSVVGIYRIREHWPEFLDMLTEASGLSANMARKLGWVCAIIAVAFAVPLWPVMVLSGNRWEADDK